MMKSRSTGHRAEVTFVLDAAVGATAASVCGDFNGWSGSGHAMVRADDGSFSLTISLEAGRRYRFRYLLDGDRWENDWAADEYVPNDFGGDDSVVDLTALADEVPSVASAPSPGTEDRTRIRAKSGVPTKPGGPTKRQPKKKAPANDAGPSAQPAKIVPPNKAAPKRQAAKNPPAAAPTAKKEAPKAQTPQKSPTETALVKKAPAKKARG